VFRTPGYPLTLAALFCFVGDDPPVMWARGLNALLGTAAVGGVVCLAWRLFDSRTAVLAGCLATLYPGAIAMSTFVLSEAPFCVLMLLQLILWTQWDRAEGVAGAGAVAVLTGAAAALATLVKPSWLLFTPFAAAVQLIGAGQRGRKAIACLTMLAAMAICLSPWWIRNWRVTGRFVPTTLQVGASLYDGLNPRATGASNMDFVYDARVKLALADAQAPAPPTDVFELRLDRMLRDQAISWASENPQRAVWLMGVKLKRMWNVWPNAAELSRWPLRVLVMVGYAPVLVCAIWGAWRSVGRGWPYVLCILPAVYFTCVHVVFVSSIRYRQPAMLPLIVLAAGALGCLCLFQNGSTTRSE
jgi:4-amino-4-deoxy-L-arabinose transferase-like glycosyltransferase